MPFFDPSKVTQYERKNIRKRAQRNVGSEVTLILTAGFAFVMIVLFFFGKLTLLPLADLLDLRPILVWIGLSVLISVAVALVHSRLASKSVGRARERQFLIEEFDESERRSENENKIKAFKGSAS